MNTRETVDRILSDTVHTMLTHRQLFPMARFIDGYARTMGNNESDTEGIIRHTLMNDCGIRKVVEQAVAHTDALWVNLAIADMPGIMRAARKTVLNVYASHSFGSNTEWLEVCEESDARE